MSETLSTRLTFEQLKWITIFVPAVVLALLLLLAEFTLESQFHSPAGYAIATMVVAAGLFVFAEVIFGIIHRLDEQLLKQNERLEISAAVATALSAARSRDESLQGVLDTILAALSLDAGVVCLLDEGPDELFSSAQRGLPPELYEMVKRAKVDSDAVGAEVIRSAHPVVIRETAADERVGELASRYGFHSVASVPMVAEGRAVGVLALVGRQAGRFDPSEMRWLEQLANQMGIAAERAALIEEVLGRNEQLRLLNDTSTALTRTLDVGEIADIILGRMIEVSGATSATLWLDASDGDEAVRTLRREPQEAVSPTPDLADGISAEGISGTSVTREEQFRLPLHADRHEFGSVLLDGVDANRLTSTRRQSLRSLAGQAGVALANALLHERVRELAIVEERERIAREMHDGLAQVLGYVNTKAFAIRRLLRDGNSPAAEEMLAQLEEAARELYADVREGVLALRTTSPHSRGLAESICDYAVRFEQMTGIEARCEIDQPARGMRLPEMTEIQVIRIVQEALTNVRKHADAGIATIEMTANGSTLRVVVSDDGRGFDVDATGAGEPPHFGLETMHERAESAGGELTVVSTPGGGTAVTVEVPLAATAEVSA
jgi:nitrate/nitrite-specific signal transduction histidine kinase